MDHAYIQENCLVERYHQGRLEPCEEARFEEHFLRCARCREELKLAQEFGLAMKDMATENARRPLSVRAGALSWLAQRPLAVRAALLLSLLALAAAPGAWLLRRSSSRPVDGPANDTPVVVLSAIRGDPRRAQSIDPAALGDRFSIALEVDAVPLVESFRVTVANASSGTILRQDGLHLNDLNVIQIEVSASLFPAGSYALLLEGEASAEAPRELGRYAFRVPPTH